jgi:antitoxin VapB
MIHLSAETEALAKRLAAAQQLTIDVAIRLALEEKARTAGLVAEMARRRMSIESMIAFGADIAAMPLLDARSPREIMDDMNAA